MATVYYPRFALVAVDVDGVRYILPDTFVDVQNITQDVSLGTLESDGNGIVEEGFFTANFNDVIEISMGGYPGTCRFMLKDTQDNAYLANHVVVWVGENVNTDETTAVAVHIYLEDIDNPNTEPIDLGVHKAGIPLEIPLQTAIPKNYRVRFVSIDEFGARSDSDLSTAEYADISIPAIIPVQRPLFDQFADATTTGTIAETLYINQIDAGTLAVNGDKITAEYAGETAANTDEKYWTVRFGGATDIFASLDFGIVIGNAVHWKLRVLLIRVSNTVLRYSVELQTTDLTLFDTTPYIKYGEVTGLNLTTTDYDIELRGYTPDAAGDITAKMGYGMFIPATVSSGVGFMTFDGSILTFDGDELTFTP